MLKYRSSALRLDIIRRSYLHNLTFMFASSRAFRLFPIVAGALVAIVFPWLGWGETTAIAREAVGIEGLTAGINSCLPPREW